VCVVLNTIKSFYFCDNVHCSIEPRPNLSAISFAS
jgi:hypothetical protein